MSYEIIYDRRFIAVGDKFIPLFQSGSSNSFEFGMQGRSIPEKNWSIFNYKFKDKVLFTKEEIIEASKAYSDCDFFKTRNTAFAEGAFEKWYIGGMNKAETIEFYTSNRNSLTAFIYGPNSQEHHSIQSTTDLLDALQKFELLITFNPSYNFYLKFNQRKLSLPKKSKEIGFKQTYPHYFVLTSKHGYFIRKTARGYKYSYYPDSYGVKKFKSEKEIKSFFKKYPFYETEFVSEKIEKEVLM